MYQDLNFIGFNLKEIIIGVNPNDAGDRHKEPLHSLYDSIKVRINIYQHLSHLCNNRLSN